MQSASEEPNPVCAYLEVSPTELNGTLSRSRVSKLFGMKADKVGLPDAN